MEIVKPRKLVHSGKKRAYPSSYVWDCMFCNSWNIFKTRNFFGLVKVCCQKCEKEFNLNKSEPLVEITRTKKMKSIID